MVGELTPGIRLVEEQLAVHVGASRTPVREALLQLLAEGFVVETPSGLVVTQVTAEDVQELYAVREPLEALAARLAAINLTPLQAAQIESLHEKLAAEAGKTEPDVRSLAAMNFEFHRAIAQATRNKFLFEALAKIYDAMGRFAQSAFQHRERTPSLVAEHQQLVAALSARDPVRAEEIARGHMRSAADLRLRIYREQQLQ